MTDNENLHPQDDARTIRSHAGEAITDSRNWPGGAALDAKLLVGRPLGVR